MLVQNYFRGSAQEYQPVLPSDREAHLCKSRLGCLSKYHVLLIVYTLFLYITGVRTIDSEFNGTKF